MPPGRNPRHYPRPRYNKLFRNSRILLDLLALSFRHSAHAIDLGRHPADLPVHFIEAIAQRSGTLGLSADISVGIWIAQTVLTAQRCVVGNIFPQR